jgi:cytochrome c553
MSERGAFSWSHPAVRWSVTALVALSVVSLLVGFIWLPSVHGDFSAQGIWASICRAAGVPAQWSEAAGTERARTRSTSVVLDNAMAKKGAADAIGRGATIAVQRCTMCHGAEGKSRSDAPNLAGQYPEVIVKQLTDYRSGDRRSSSVMEGLSAGLSDRDIEDLAAYYGDLPRTASPALAAGASAPALVRVGDPLRNIAPCASCHGGIDHKLGTPWLEGMPKQYLLDQLNAFASGSRRNDSHAQMRNMARAMNAKEIEEAAAFYARGGEVR